MRQVKLESDFEDEGVWVSNPDNRQASVLVPWSRIGSLAAELIAAKDAHAKRRASR